MKCVAELAMITDTQHARTCVCSPQEEDLYSMCEVHSRLDVYRTPRFKANG